MDMAMLTRFFMWCTILNMGLLALSILILTVAADAVYRMHGKWFPMPRETFTVVIYSFLGVYKIFLLVFNIVPWAALVILR